MTGELQDHVESKVEAVVDDAIDYCIEHDTDLAQATDSALVSQWAQAKAESAHLNELMDVIDAGPLGLDTMAGEYQHCDMKQAVVNFAALNLIQLAYDRLDTLLGNGE